MSRQQPPEKKLKCRNPRCCRTISKRENHLNAGLCVTCMRAALRMEASKIARQQREDESK